LAGFIGFFMGFIGFLPYMVFLRKRKPPRLLAEGESKCGNCEYGMKLKGCGLGKNEVFCDVYEFKCSADNVCDAWESMEEESEEESD